MKVSIITLFPEMFANILTSSIMGRAEKKSLVNYQLINLREFGEGKHQVVDDAPYGGGAGMLLRADILAKAWQKAVEGSQPKPYTILTSASGHKFNQTKAGELSRIDHLVIVCGHYEGVDQRFIDRYVNEELSIGDFVLTGGEVPALAIADSVIRLIPGVLNKTESIQNESFSNELLGLLEYPQYTRPADFEGLKVPEILQSGHHQEIDKWRKQKSLEKTKNSRPDLI